MRKLQLALCVSLLVLAVTAANAQASRTWVSGVGDDANPCSRTAPCKTFAGAISKTAAGGEIDALDPGGFGALTITKAITIHGGGGQVASVLVAGTNGIVVQAGPSDVVIIRNLRINGIGVGINGIRFLSGKNLNVENCYIFGFTTNGIDIALNQATASSVEILNSVIKQSGGVGIRATNASTPAVLVGISETAVILDVTGIQATGHAHVSVTRGVVQNASTTGIEADSTTSDAIVTVDHTDVTLNNNGMTAASGGFIVSGDNKVAFNTGTGFNQAGGSIFSFGTNRLHNNSIDGSSHPIAQQ